MNLTTRIERLYRYPVKLRDLLREESEDSREETNSNKKKDKPYEEGKLAPIFRLNEKETNTKKNHIDGRGISHGDNQISTPKVSLSCDEQMKYSKGIHSLLPISKQLQVRDAIQTSQKKPNNTGGTLDYVI